MEQHPIYMDSNALEAHGHGTGKKLGSADSTKGIRRDSGRIPTELTRPHCRRIQYIRRLRLTKSWSASWSAWLVTCGPPIISYPPKTLAAVYHVLTFARRQWHQSQECPVHGLPSGGRNRAFLVYGQLMQSEDVVVDLIYGSIRSFGQCPPLFIPDIEA
jgi:hypothetical protein